MRIPLAKREASAYIKLRRKGWSINLIANAFGRSTSVVHRRIRKAIRKYGIIPYFDLRKMQAYRRKIHKQIQVTLMRKYYPLWEGWVLGEEGEPP